MDRKLVVDLTDDTSEDEWIKSLHRVKKKAKMKKEIPSNKTRAKIHVSNKANTS